MRDPRAKRWNDVQMVMMCPNTSGNLTIVNHPFGNGKHIPIYGEIHGKKYPLDILMKFHEVTIFG